MHPINREENMNEEVGIHTDQTRVVAIGRGLHASEGLEGETAASQTLHFLLLLVHRRRHCRALELVALAVGLFIFRPSILHTVKNFSKCLWNRTGESARETNILTSSLVHNKSGIEKKQRGEIELV